MKAISPSLKQILRSDDAEGFQLRVSRGLLNKSLGDSSVLELCVRHNAEKCLSIALSAGAATPEESELVEILKNVRTIGSEHLLFVLDNAGFRFSGRACSEAAWNSVPTLENLYALGYRVPGHRPSLNGHPLESIKRAIASNDINAARYDVVSAVDTKLAGWMALAFEPGSDPINRIPRTDAISALEAKSVEGDEDELMLLANRSNRVHLDRLRDIVMRICSAPGGTENLSLTHLVTRERGGDWAKSLVQAGLPLDATHHLGKTHVDLAMEADDIDAANVFAKAGTPVSGWNYPTDPSVEKGLIWAKRFIVRERCYVPLLAQLSRSAIQMRRALKQHPCLIDQAAIDGTTPLMWASILPLELVDTLLLSARDIHSVDRQGWNALHHAARRSVYGEGSRRLIELLLEAGIDPRTRDRMGRTPIDLLDADPDPKQARCQTGEIDPRSAAHLLIAATRQRNISDSLRSSPPPVLAARPTADVL